MKQYGYVTEVLDNKVKVRVIRESSCGGNCVSCKGCPAEAVIVDCTANESVCIGEKVALIMKDTDFYKGVFWGYGQSVLMMLIFAILGYALFKTEAASVLGAVLGLVFGIGLAKIVFTRKKIEIIAEKADKD